MTTELMAMPEPTAPAHRGGSAAGVIHAMEELKAVRTFVAKELAEGHDFGKIPGAGDKPTLLLPGAQKIVMLFNCTPDYQIQASELGGGHVEYVVTARLHSRANGNVVGSGVGSCTTMEKKYRWRAGGVACPLCGVGLRKSKDKPEWYCWQKQGGCGATFPLNDPAVKGQAGGQVENPDIYDLRNTVLKMAKKRALVDASMGLGCLSELFTQDLEDIYDLSVSPAPEPRREPAPPQGGRMTADPGDYGGGPPRRDRGRPELLGHWIDQVVNHWSGFDRIRDQGERESRRAQVTNHLATWATAPRPAGGPLIDPGAIEKSDGKRDRNRTWRELARLYQDDGTFALMRAEVKAYLEDKKAALAAPEPTEAPEPAEAEGASQGAAGEPWRTPAPPDAGEAWEPDGKALKAHCEALKRRYPGSAGALDTAIVDWIAGTGRPGRMIDFSTDDVIACEDEVLRPWWRSQTGRE